MANADHLRDANPWHPMTDPVAVKHLGKLSEEAGELCSAISRCIIQGIDEREPTTGKLNREWLEDEIADVLASVKLNISNFKLDEDRVRQRMSRKMQHLQQWHKMD
jgi:NTP pyrophosphatase (non-canonical NTP hydrolase)